MAPRVVVTPVAPLAAPTSAGGESWGLAPLHPVQRPVRVSVVASAASGAPMRHHHVGRARARGVRWPGHHGGACGSRDGHRCRPGSSPE